MIYGVSSGWYFSTSAFTQARSGASTMLNGSSLCVEPSEKRSMVGPVRFLFASTRMSKQRIGNVSVRVNEYAYIAPVLLLQSTVKIVFKYWYADFFRLALRVRQISLARLGQYHGCILDRFFGDAVLYRQLKHTRIGISCRKCRHIPLRVGGGEIQGKKRRNQTKSHTYSDCNRGKKVFFDCSYTKPPFGGLIYVYVCVAGIMFL